MMESTKRQVILVSGLSGAGKTTTLSIFEDMGYLCMDNFPNELVGQLLDLIQNTTTSTYQKVVLGINIMDLAHFDSLARQDQVDVRLVLLTASETQLLSRYKHNRRIHPLVKADRADSIVSAIRMEQDQLNLQVSRQLFAYDLLDTTFLTKASLLLTLKDRVPLFFKLKPIIHFLSFGFRFGLPLDADYIFDVRFLDNPYWVADLRYQTGHDQGVIDHVMKDPKTTGFMAALIPLLDEIMKGSLLMDRSILTIGIGCTGGQHRSVVVAKTLYDHYQASDFSERVSLLVSHRDTQRNLQEILSR